MDGTIKNRLVQTHYFIGPYKQIDISKQKLSDKEKNSNFRLELISLDDLENIILNSDNPRQVYFQKELFTIINNYKNI